MSNNFLVWLRSVSQQKNENLRSTPQIQDNRYISSLQSLSFSSIISNSQQFNHKGKITLQYFQIIINTASQILQTQRTSNKNNKCYNTFNYLLTALRFYQNGASAIKIQNTQMDHNSDSQISYPLIDPHKLILAFKIMRENVGHSSLLQQSNEYFNACEMNPDFSFKLMQLFNESEDPLLKKQALGLLKNVIKRNWTACRRTAQICYFSEELKTMIKNGIVELYKIYWEHYYKLFNQIFQYIARLDFPTNYLSLYEFMIQVLQTLVSYDLPQILSSKELLPYLSTVKKVLKEYGQKRIKHDEQQYRTYIEPILHHSSTIFNKIGQALQQMSQNPQNNFNKAIAINLLQCSRKIDKIILYSFEAATTTMQRNQLIINLCKQLMMKLMFLLQFPIASLRQQCQMNILAIVQGFSRLQSLYPFYFTSFLGNYLKLMLNLLFAMNSDNPRLVNAVIIACKKPLTLYSYYVSPTQFESSIYCRKGQCTLYIPEQIQCHQTYLQTYGGGNALVLIRKLVSELFIKYCNEDEDNELIFEDSEANIQNINNEQSSGELVVLFARDLLLRFKQPLKPFLSDIYNHILNSSDLNSPLINAMQQILLILPKINDESYLDMQSICGIMKKLYNTHNFSMLIRYIRSYQVFFSKEMLTHSFQILVSIVCHENMPHLLVYQCAICIKKLINENEQEDLPLSQMGYCLTNIFKLLAIYKSNHNHLWNLLHLLNQMMRALSNQSVMKNITVIMENINMMIQLKDNDMTTLEAITDLLEHVIEILTMEKNQQHLQLSFRSNQLCIKHIEQSFALFMNSVESCGAQILLRLWLTVMKNHENIHSTQQFNEKLVSMYHNLSSLAINSSQILFCEILEQYMLSRLFNLAPSDIIRIFQQMKADGTQLDRQNGSENRNILAVHSVYFTYSLITQTCVPQILIFIMRELQYLTNKISPTANALRTQLMLILSYHLITFGSSNIFQIYDSIWPNYTDWFWPIIWSLQYINHRYACKTISISLLNSLDCFNDTHLKTPIQEKVPIIGIIKFISNNIEPLKDQQAVTSYMNTLRIVLHAQDTLSNRSRYRNSGPKGIARKIRLHVNREWSQSNLKQLFKQKISILCHRWQWNEKIIEQQLPRQVSKKILEFFV